MRRKIPMINEMYSFSSPLERLGEVLKKIKNAKR